MSEFSNRLGESDLTAIIGEQMRETAEIVCANVFNQALEELEPGPDIAAITRDVARGT